MDTNSFPCTGCGACCKRINNLEAHIVKDDPEHMLYFPYSWDENGVCENLNLEDNSCNVYETRPTMCNIDKMFQFVQNGMSKKEYYNVNIFLCNKMIEEDGLDEKFKVIPLQD
jgi:Fe-S-cluster containining protein